MVFVTLPPCRREEVFDPAKVFVPPMPSQGSSHRGSLGELPYGGETCPETHQPAGLRGLYPGSKFEGSQRSGRSSYDVEVELQVRALPVTQLCQCFFLPCGDDLEFQCFEGAAGVLHACRHVATYHFCSVVMGPSLFSKPFCHPRSLPCDSLSLVPADSRT